MHVFPKAALLMLMGELLRTFFTLLSTVDITSYTGLCYK
jgi:hypothetical protein